MQPELAWPRMVRFQKYQTANPILLWYLLIENVFDICDPTKKNTLNLSLPTSTSLVNTSAKGGQGLDSQLQDGCGHSADILNCSLHPQAPRGERCARQPCSLHSGGPPPWRCPRQSGAHPHGEWFQRSGHCRQLSLPREQQEPQSCSFHWTWNSHLGMLYQRDLNERWGLYRHVHGSTV